jgi:cellulose synthase/poly-beta-1,6-N-acetylglucosamine synthase-like glycosyltransferase
VNEPLPKVTIIIPTRPGQAEIPAVTAARELDYPRDLVEIIVARGKQPAVQRNAAIKAAQGDLIYFLDDDSRPPLENLRRGVRHFQEAKVTMVGGPNLCPGDAPRLEQVFSVVLSSWLAFGPSRARYDKVGRVRSSGEKELILCNLMARRKDLAELGGFDESLYPNEENALMDELQKRGSQLLYDPEFLVHRRPRPTLKAFVKMLFNYGRGRAEQFRLHPTPGSVLNFVPPLFCLYLVLAPLFGLLGLVPLAFYGLAVLVQTLASAGSKGFGKALLALPLVVLTHICYGIGFWRGLFTRVERGKENTSIEVTLEKISL